ncbi:NAD-dependent succinate-semialdehyde dehydrogenase [Saprospiraceae bacterium]|nr:NAD-dependent succinate-semialdehyde dehydrogenase [Saprospiraceae bacterium]MDA9866327.1 NAD-dependent succinate-semialdehyde dehydrogenase [Saprospiraceae bacterium]MDB4824233.1 NAD-dependent succinate-semialdehyde dehydrogenase [Saprospiraceae bacterium]
MDIKDKSLLRSEAYINGEWIKKETTFSVYNPYNQIKIAEVSDCTQVDTESAITAADHAFQIWSNYTANKRSRILQNWYKLIIENATDLAHILTIEQGKPLQEAIGEIKYGASYIEWFAEEAKRVYGDVIPGQSRKNRITVIKQPVGIVGAITPWNFPSAMITRKVAPALAAGCTVIVKPSEFTPLSALALAELSDRAGFPKGVINIITTKDAAAIGQSLTSNSKVKKISFTGSTPVGKIVLKQSADQIKKVTLELGGNAPFIVFADADIDAAVSGCYDSKFRNGGQTCVCTNRIFLHESIHNEFIEKFATKVKSIKTGYGLDKGVEIGPMINEDAVIKDINLIKDATNKGAKVIAGGMRKKGLFIEPTILCNIDSNMDIFSSEIFGPIAAIYKFNSESEVIEIANNTKYGLASYFYGRDYKLIWRVAEALEFGMVGINTGLMSTVAAPFGGIKESGFGREGSKYGIDEYLNIKYMCWGDVE